MNHETIKRFGHHWLTFILPKYAQNFWQIIPIDDAGVKRRGVVLVFFESVSRMYTTPYFACIFRDITTWKHAISTQLINYDVSTYFIFIAVIGRSRPRIMCDKLINKNSHYNYTPINREESIVDQLDYRQYKNICDIKVCDVVRCTGCSITALSMRKCSGCTIMCYCSRECQIRDWQRHKGLCKELDKLISTDESSISQDIIK